MINHNFLITLLSSSDEKLLKLSYESVLNQINHNINYNIVLIINTLDTNYYNQVIQDLKILV